MRKRSAFSAQLLQRRPIIQSKASLYRSTQYSESSPLFRRSGVSDSLRPRGLPHTRLPCPSPSPGVCSNSRPFVDGNGHWKCPLHGANEALEEAAAPRGSWMSLRGLSLRGPHAPGKLAGPRGACCTLQPACSPVPHLKPDDAILGGGQGAALVCRSGQDSSRSRCPQDWDRRHKTGPEPTAVPESKEASTIAAPGGRSCGQHQAVSAPIKVAPVVKNPPANTGDIRQAG